MAKKAPAKKAPAKRKPAAKKQPASAVVEPSKPTAWRSRLLFGGAGVAALLVGFVGGIWIAGGVPVGPSKATPDAVSAVFDAQESSFRQLSGERAKALRADELKSEAESVAWMQSRFIPACEAEWAKLLTAEATEFGGEKWTAEKEAATIERYVR